jgi:hypothetical protein
MAMVRLTDDSTSVQVPARGLDGTRSTVKLGVRPEKIKVEPDSGHPPDAGWNWVVGTLRLATFVGVGHQFTIDGPEGRALTVYSQNLGAADLPAAGERVRLLWRPDHTFVVTASAPLADWEEER